MDLVGIWKSQATADLKENMKLLGIPEAFVNIADNVGLQLEISKNGEEYNVKQKAVVTIFEYKFKPGQPFSTQTFTKKSLTGVAKIEGNTMVEESKENDVSSVTTLKVTGNTLTKTRNFGNSSCVISYNKA